MSDSPAPTRPTQGKAETPDRWTYEGFQSKAGSGGTRRGRVRRWSGRLLDESYSGAIVALFSLIVWASFSQPGFLTFANFLNIAQTNAALSIACIGMTFVVLIGGVDLSVGGAAALSGVAFGMILSAGVPGVLALALMVVAAPLAGMLLNGFVIAYMRLNFFVVTLGTASLFSGLALGFSGGSTLPLYEEPIVLALGTAELLGLSVALWIVAGSAAVSCILLYCTGYGRMVYAIGGNPQAAHLAGINVKRIRLLSYTLCFFFAALAGVVTVGRLQAADPGAGADMALLAAAAVLLGGNSFYGGEGGIGRTFLGVAFLAVLANLLTLSGVSGFWQGVITGTVLILAVGFDRLRRSPADLEV